MDDTFVIFDFELDYNRFHKNFNLLHPALKFTVEKEQNNSVNFLVVLVEKEDTEFLISVYGKPAFTGQCIRWHSFSSKARKISHIKTLVHRALVICSRIKLCSELDRINQLLFENGCTEDVLHSCIAKTSQLCSGKPFDPEKFPVYFKLPWIGKVSSKCEKQINEAIISCFYDVKLRVVYITRVMLPSAKKDSIATTQKSCVVYEFSCSMPVRRAHYAETSRQNKTTCSHEHQELKHKN